MNQGVTSRLVPSAVPASNELLISFHTLRPHPVRPLIMVETRGPAPPKHSRYRLLLSHPNFLSHKIR